MLAATTAEAQEAPDSQLATLANGRSLPIASWSLIALLLLIFVVQINSASDFASAFSPSRRDLIADGGLAGKLVFSGDEWWRLFTAPLLHASPTHIVGNIIALLLAGFILEPLIGAGWFSGLFAVSALGGSVGSLLENDPNLVSVGASGGIMGLLTAGFCCSFMFEDSRRRRRMQVISLQIMIPALLPALFPAAATGGHVDYGAHAAGCAVGGMMGFFFNALLSEKGVLPLRDLAAGMAGIIGAVAATGFFLVAQNHDVYIAQGKDLIPDRLLPKDVKSGAAASSDLIEHYPNDPRSHLYKACDFINQRDLSGADSELHLVLSNPLTTSGDMPPQFAAAAKSMLALVLQGEGQTQSARDVAKDVCADRSIASSSGIRRSLESRHLCE